MSNQQWVTIGRKYCELIKQDVAIMQLRSYPSGMINAGLGSYRVHETKCTAAVDCNMAGVPCSWSFTNPDSDRYALD